mgnify:CR=1 FL=1
MVVVHPPGGVSSNQNRISHGDLLVRVGDEAVTDFASFGALIQRIRERKPEEVVLFVERGRESFFFAVKPDWKSFGEYLDRIDGKLAINTVFLVGHSALRRAVMGERSLTDKATPADMDAMCSLLRRSLAEGGAGFSTTVANTHSSDEKFCGFA